MPFLPVCDSSVSLAVYLSIRHGAAVFRFLVTPGFFTVLSVMIRLLLAHNYSHQILPDFFTVRSVIKRSALLQSGWIFTPKSNATRREGILLLFIRTYRTIYNNIPDKNIYIPVRISLFQTKAGTESLLHLSGYQSSSSIGIASTRRFRAVSASKSCIGLFGVTTICCSSV